MNEIIHSKEHEEITDDKLRNLFHTGALQAPPSPWFTQNVLHRLPDRKRRVASFIEYALYIIGIIATVIYTTIYVINTLKSSVVTVNDVITYTILVALFVSLCYMVIAPFVRRDIQKA